MGLKEIREFWKERGVWPTNTGTENGRVQLQPSDEVFAGSGRTIGARDDDPELYDTICVEYENGETFAFQSDSERKRFEYEMGYGAYSTGEREVKQSSADLSPPETA